MEQVSSLRGIRTMSARIPQGTNVVDIVTARSRLAQSRQPVACSAYLGTVELLRKVKREVFSAHYLLVNSTMTPEVFKFVVGELACQDANLDFIIQSMLRDGAMRGGE